MDSNEEIVITLSVDGGFTSLVLGDFVGSVLSAFLSSTEGLS